MGSHPTAQPAHENISAAVPTPAQEVDELVAKGQVALKEFERLNQSTRPSAVLWRIKRRKIYSLASM